MKYYVETHSSKSDRWKGPIDSSTGFPTIDPRLITEATSETEARVFFETQFPNDVLAVLLLDQA